MRFLIILSIALFLVTCKDSVSVNEFYSMKGKVISEHTGTGIPNARILVNNILIDTTDNEGNYLIPRLRNESYSIKILPELHHLPLVINSLMIPSEDSYLDFSLKLKYNLVDSILTSFGVLAPNSIIGSYSQSSGPIVLQHNWSSMEFEFERYITNDDTLEFAFSHNSGEAFYFQYLRISFGTERDAISSLLKTNDGVIRTVKFYPPFSESDSSKTVILSNGSDNNSIVNLKIYYFVSY